MASKIYARYFVKLINVHDGVFPQLICHKWHSQISINIFYCSSNVNCIHFGICIHWQNIFAQLEDAVNVNHLYINSNSNIYSNFSLLHILFALFSWSKWNHHSLHSSKFSLSVGFPLFTFMRSPLTSVWNFAEVNNGRTYILFSYYCDSEFKQIVWMEWNGLEWLKE